MTSCAPLGEKMPITKILAANRSEIAIRVFRAANELGHVGGRGQIWAASLQGG